MPFTSETAKIAGKKGKRGKSKTTQTRQTLGKDESYETRLQVLRNMQEALYSEDREERMRATKDFAEYFVPKKREHSGDLLSDIVIEVKIAEN